MNGKVLKELLILIAIIAAIFLVIDQFSFGDDIEVGSVSVETEERFAEN